MARVCAELGHPLMPWQAYVADVALEVDPDSGLLAYSNVGVSVPRQSGKTSLVGGVMQHRALSGANRRVWYTAQTAKAATEWFMDEHAPAVEQSAALGGVCKVRRARGSEGILWPGLGSLVRCFAPTRASLHSKQSDLVVVDEAWAHDQQRGEELDQAIVPTQATRPGAQVWKPSTAGTEESTWFWRTVTAGREAVQAGRTEGVAWFEWGCPEELDPCAPSSWERFHPAMGITIGVAQMRSALADLGDVGFARAYGNRWPAGMGESSRPVLAMADWERARRPGAGLPPKGRVAFGFDVAHDRVDGSVVACWQDGTARFLEVVDHRPGTSWLVGRVAELVERWQPVAVGYDMTGPALDVADRLMLGGLELVGTRTSQYAAACAGLAAWLEERRLMVSPHPALDAAVQAAVSRPVGDGGWVWSRRRAEVSLAPLVAATLAGWALDHPPEPAPAVAGWLAY